MIHVIYLKLLSIVNGADYGYQRWLNYPEGSDEVDFKR